MPGEITTLLERWNAGSSDAREELIAKTYDELRRLARRQLRAERAGHTLQATALLNEVCLRMLPQGPRAAATREAFFRLMAAEMRRRLVDHARRRLADKRGAGAAHVVIDDVLATASAAPDEPVHASLDRLDQAVLDLAVSYPRAAEVVRLRFMADLTIDEVAVELGISTGTVKREWTFAKAWLAAALDAET